MTNEKPLEPWESDNSEAFTEVYLPIKDLTGCTSALLMPIELSQEKNKELKNTLDSRIYDQIIKQYIPVSATMARVKPMILQRNPKR